MDITNPEMWRQEWTAFQSAPFIMLAGVMVVGVAAWGLNWIRFSGRIAGLEGEKAVLQRRLEAEIAAKNGEISFLERQLKDTADKLVGAGTATDEVEKRFKILEDAIAAKAENAALAALASQVQSAVGDLGKANNEISKVVSQKTWDQFLSDLSSGSAGAGMGSLVPPEEWEKVRDYFRHQKPADK
jgi:ABC-type amino acid transport substrate-binding protein